ncbi:hypothetical protein [uncultured Robinsoniella sp.]
MRGKYTAKWGVQIKYTLYTEVVPVMVRPILFLG